MKIASREIIPLHNTSWGLDEKRGLTLQPGQSYISEATELWNSKPQIPRQGEGKS